MPPNDQEGAPRTGRLNPNLAKGDPTPRWEISDMRSAEQEDKCSQDRDNEPRAMLALFLKADIIRMSETVRLVESVPHTRLIYQRVSANRLTIVEGGGELMAQDGSSSAWGDLGPDNIPGEPAEPTDPAVVVIWIGWEAERIQQTAALLGREPRDMVRWAVTRTIEESTFVTARERALAAHLGRGGEA